MSGTLKMAIVTFAITAGGCDGVTDPLDSVAIALNAPIIAAVGDELTLTLTMTNRTDDRIELPVEAPGDSAIDVLFSRTNGTLAWRRHARPSIGPATRIVLSAREVLDFTVVLNLSADDGTPLPADTYSVKAILRSDFGRVKESDSRTITIG